MTLKHVFTLNAYVALGYGIVLVGLTSWFLSMYGITLDPGTHAVSQLFGVSLLAVGLITWLARDAEPSVARHAIVMGLFWTDLLGAAIAAFAQFTGAINALGWTSVAVYVLLAVAYGRELYGAREVATAG